MSVKIRRLTVGKGRTVADEQHGQWEWDRLYFEIEVDNETDLEITRANALGLLDGWLSATYKPVAIPPPQPCEIRLHTLDRLNGH